MQSHLDRIITLLKVMSGGILCGISFGFVMSLVSNGFVIGVQWLTTFRESSLLQTFTIGGLPFSLGPLCQPFFGSRAAAGCETTFPHYTLAWSGRQYLRRAPH